MPTKAKTMMDRVVHTSQDAVFRLETEPNNTIEYVTLLSFLDDIQEKVLLLQYIIVVHVHVYMYVCLYTSKVHVHVCVYMYVQVDISLDYVIIFVSLVYVHVLRVIKQCSVHAIVIDLLHIHVHVHYVFFLVHVG